MNIVSFVISEFASVKAHGGLTIVHVFNQLRGPGPEWGLPVMYLTIITEAHPKAVDTTHELEVRLIDAGRKPVLDKPFRSKISFSDRPDGPLPGMPLRHITTAGIFGARFKKPGPYAFEAYIDGIYSGSATLYINQTGEPQQ